MSTSGSTPEFPAQGGDPVPRSSPGFLPSGAGSIPAWFRGGSLLYLASAVCILVGIYSIIVPIYERPELAMEKFGCLLALNLYEVMLMAVALIIVLRRRVTDDAIALTVLIAAFLVGSATALDTVAPAFGSPAVMLGLAGLILAGGKLYVLDRHLSGKFAQFQIAGLGLLFIWNFLMPGILGWAIGDHLSVEPLREFWLAGFTVIIAGGALLYVESLELPCRAAGLEDRNKSFLEASLMRWIIILLITAGTAVHLFALNWAFGTNFEWGDLLVMVAAFCLIGFELRRGYARQLLPIDPALLYLPLAFAVVALLTGGYSIGLDWAPSALLYPPVTLIAISLVLGAVSLRPMVGKHGSYAFRAIRWQFVSAGVSYLIMGILAMGATPGRSLDLGALHWETDGGVLLAMLLIAAVTRHSFRAALAAVTLISLGTCFAPVTRDFFQTMNFQPVSCAAVIFGVGVLSLHMIFVSRESRRAAYAGAWLLMVGSTQCYFARGVSGAAWPLITAVGIVSFVVGISFWTRDWPLALAGFPPLAVASYQSLAIRFGWLLVILSFLMLAAGAVASWRKKPQDGSDEVAPAMGLVEE